MIACGKAHSASNEQVGWGDRSNSGSMVSRRFEFGKKACFREKGSRLLSSQQRDKCPLCAKMA